MATPKKPARPRAKPRGRVAPGAVAPMHAAAPADERARVTAVVRALAAAYPGATTELAHRTPFELLIATILSAQSTDVTINAITPALFARFPDARALAAADLAEVERMIRASGFFHNKAKAIIGASRELTARFGGEVPRTIADLVTLPGVARKTANVVLGTAYGVAAGVVVDTHVRRLAQRLGLTAHDEPEKIELDLMAKVPRDHWIVFAHDLILHGRRVCVARKPRCSECVVAPHCPASFTFA
ncbi:MAG TPA: endonuclease III [Polyangia bacterium]|jgi:endonuclease-3